MKKILLFILNIAVMLSCYYVTLNYSGVDFNSLFTTSILSISLLYFEYKLFDSMHKNYNKKRFLFSLPIGLFFSLCIIVGTNLYTYDASLLDKYQTYIFAILGSPIYISINHLLFYYMDKIRDKKIDKKENKNTSNKIYDFIFNKKAISFIIIFSLLFISWFIVFLAFYPGVFSYDSSVQINEFYKGIGVLTNNNPILHTLFLGSMFNIGNNVFNNYAIGVVLYTIIQIIIVDIIYTYFILFLNKNCKFKPLVIVTFLLLWLLPLHSTFVQITTKDVFYSACNLLLLIQIYKMVKYNETFFKSKKEIILTIIYVLLTFITRHNGYYTFLVLSVFMFIGLRKYWKQVLLIIIVCLGTYKIYLNKVNEILQVKKTISFNNVLLCLPMQQIARTFNFSDNLTEEEIQLWEHITTRENVYQTYERTKSDAILWYIEPIRIDKNLNGYIKSYLKIFTRNKLIYFDAFLFQTIGYWYPGDPLPDKTTYRAYFELRSRDDFGITRDEIHFDSKFEKLFERYYDLMEKGEYQQVPILSILMNISLYFWILLITLIYLLYKKEFNKFIPYAPLLGLIVTLFLGPVSLVRYSYPIIIAAPLLIALSLDDKFEIKDNHYFKIFQKKNKKKSKH